jgi:hypothetical protein
MIDLHLHSTASDGDFAPRDVVSKAWHAGLRTIAITDHDTVAGVAEAREAGSAIGVEVIAGIEITAVHAARDVHVLGYFVDPADGDLLAFLADQRADRVARVREMARRLGNLGLPIDADALLAPYAGTTDRSVGRPAVARALVAAGHVTSIGAAFDTLIGSGCPAFVPRRGAGPADVVRVIHAAGGVASLAHPGLLQRDDVIPSMVAARLDALEAYHSDHTADDVERYRTLAGRHGLAVSGGSDFHGESRHPRATLGSVTLPAEEFDRLAARVPAR